MKPQKYLAEFFGAMCLTLAVSFSIASGAFPPPVAAGLTLGLFVYTVGGISGAHLNPAVTLAMWSVKKMKFDEAVVYIVAQLLGGVAAMFLFKLGNGGFINEANALGLDLSVDAWKVGIGEAVGAFMLAFGVSSVVWKKAPADAAGAVIGTSLLLGALMTVGMSAGFLNPAVAVGHGAFSVMYLAGPLVGAVLGAGFYRFLQSK